MNKKNYETPDLRSSQTYENQPESSAQKTTTMINKLELEGDSSDEEKRGYEHLQGSIKSQFALKFKLQTDLAIESAFERKKVDTSKSKTKGRFQVEIPTNAAVWVVDKEW